MQLLEHLLFLEFHHFLAFHVAVTTKRKFFKRILIQLHVKTSTCQKQIKRGIKTIRNIEAESDVSREALSALGTKSLLLYVRERRPFETWVRKAH